MPFTYKIDTNIGLIFYSGFNVNGAEMLQVEKASSNDPSRLPSMKILVDLSEAALDISLSDLYEVIKLNRNRIEKDKDLEVTAVVSRSRFAQTLGDTFRLLGDGMPVRLGIFSTLSDAIKWLGLSERQEEILELQKEIMNKLKNDTVS